MSLFPRRACNGCASAGRAAKEPAIPAVTAPVISFSPNSLRFMPDAPCPVWALLSYVSKSGAEVCPASHPGSTLALMAGSNEQILAGDRRFQERTQKLAEQIHARFRYHSIELPDGSVLPGLQSIEYLRWRLSLFGLPGDLRGKRVLDIGAWDGWFSFECERR